MKKHAKRTDEEWISLIWECRTSSLSNKCWCEEHHIHISSFYYHIRRLRKMAGERSEPELSSFPKQPEIVQLSFHDPVVCPIPTESSAIKKPSKTAVKITTCSIQVEITNEASREIIFDTLSALQRLC